MEGGGNVRYRHALLTLFVAAVAALAAPSAAFAQLEVTDEATGQHCGSVSVSAHAVSGGCKSHFTGEVEYWMHVFGVETLVTRCQKEITLYWNEERLITGYSVVLFNEPFGDPCTRRSCREAGGGEQPWPGDSSEAGGGESIRLTSCIEPLGGGTDQVCTVDLPLVDTSDHSFQIGDGTEVPGVGTAGFRCEEVAELHVEATPNAEAGETDFEVTHL